LINSPTFSSLNGGQINMPGSSKYIDLGQKFNFTSENFSISTWVYLDSFVTINNPGQAPVAFFKGDYQQMGYYSQIFSDGSFGIFTSQSGNSQFSNSLAGILTTSAWNNLSYVRNGSSIRLYLNGIDRTSTVASHNNPRSSNQTFKINYYKNDYLISGQMRTSQFLIYNRALSAQEIQQNYNATKGRFLNALPPVRNGLVLELDALSYSGFGNTWYDLSGSNYHTTLTNGPTLSGSGTTLSIAFDGSNDYGISNINKTVLGSSFTISFLFSVASSAYGCIFQFADQLVTGVPWIFLNRESSSLINWYINGEYRLQAGVSTTENAFISITYSNNLWTSYKNGAALGTTSTGIGSYGGNNLIFATGYFAPTNSKFNLFTIHNRALSAYEIKQNFDYYRTRYGI